MTRNPAPGGQITARSGVVGAHSDTLTGFQLQESFPKVPDMPVIHVGGGGPQWEMRQCPQGIRCAQDQAFPAQRF